MSDFLQELLHEASWLTQAGRLQDAAESIQRVLLGVPSAASMSAAMPVAEAPAPAALPAIPEARGEFIAGSHTRAAQTLDYKLYVPPGHAAHSLPLVMLLHGCGQDPDDFAAGTGMNERSRELGGQGFFVLYPAQSQQANPQRCWSWFKHNHQGRGRGEPALLVAMLQSVMTTYAIDARRVYVAGLSAGAAMAAIVADAYPEIFAAAGVHSGLAPGVASDVSQALTVMMNGAADEAPRSSARVPTIVFHGEHDQTVHPRNGEQVIGALRSGKDSATVEQGRSPQGRRYTRSTHLGDDGKVFAEHWLLHGAGHAWSGGQAAGSFTDAMGPDATGEMLRFFWAHPRPADR